MNPIMTQVKSNVNQSQPHNGMTQMIKDLQSGKLDPKKKSLEFLENITPTQRDFLRQSIPKLRLLGQSLGIKKDEIDSFVSDLNEKL